MKRNTKDRDELEREIVAFLNEASTKGGDLYTPG
jgi:hypothetical protein